MQSPSARPKRKRLGEDREGGPLCFSRTLPALNGRNGSLQQAGRLTPGSRCTSILKRTTPMNPIRLPGSFQLDIRALSRLFRHTTTSYKHLFFLALLRTLRDQGFAPDRAIPQREIVVEMLILAWYPLNYFRLSFGAMDQVAKVLDRMPTLAASRISPVAAQQDQLREAISLFADSMNAARLLRWVPYRLLRTFFQEETRGLKDSQVNNVIFRVAEETFPYGRPLYCFEGPRRDILMHPDWLHYLKINFRIVHSWASWEWLQFVQSRNPSVPAVARKLFPPEERGALNAQSDYWRLVLAQEKIHCIYSGKRLTAEKFALDHYLPWSFVAHDQLWNLVPVAPEANSSKADSLPSREYFEKFVALQALGLRITQEMMPKRKWSRLVEPFLTDLRVAVMDDLFEPKRLSAAYQASLEPLFSLAANQGFALNWRYRKSELQSK
jgi:hypothetical protein